MDTKAILIGAKALFLLVLSSCASIVSTSAYEYRIESEPNGAKAEILQNGQPVGKVTTPGSFVMDLDHDYAVRFSLDGHKETTVIVQKGVDGWVWGNILIGGLIGLAIDYGTGAMYKPDNGIALVRVSLEKTTASLGEPSQTVARLQLVDNDRRTIEAVVPMKPGQGAETLSIEDYLVKN